MCRVGLGKCLAVSHQHKFNTVVSFVSCAQCLADHEMQYAATHKVHRNSLAKSLGPCPLVALLSGGRER